ncbi:hypothetical protein ACTXT7_003789 [Hymenolepis weldensis]
MPFQPGGLHFFRARLLSGGVGNGNLNPKLEKCVRCEKTVYAVERVEAGGQIWHKGCFRCGICDLVLNLNSYKQADQQLYCGKHYQELVLAKNTQTPV